MTMTVFEIYETNEGVYYPVYRFQTRFRPAMLLGNAQHTYEKCLAAIKDIKSSFINDGAISFESNGAGFRFVVKHNQKRIANSRYFPEEASMKRMFGIVKAHIQDAAIENLGTVDSLAA